MKRNVRLAFTLLVVLTQVFFYGLHWFKVDTLTTDFPYFYITARLWETGQNPYDLKNQCRAQAELRPSAACAGNAHTPVLLPLWALVSNDNYVSSYWRWSVFQVLIIICCALLLHSLSGVWASSIQSLLFLPVIVGLWFGNDTSVLLLSVFLWAWLLMAQKDFWAGIALSLLVIKPHLAIPLALPLLFVKPRAFYGFVVGGFVLTLFSFALVGLEGFRGIVETTRALSQGRIFGGVSQAAMLNTTGILIKAGLSPVWAWPIYFVATACLTLFVKRNGLNRATISICLIVLVFISPHIFFYDLALLALPLVYAHPLAPPIAAVLGLMALGTGVLSVWVFIPLLVLLAYLVVRRSATECPAVA